MKVIVVLLALVAVASSLSLCDKYSQLLNVTNVQLMTSIVTGTVNAVVATGTPTRPFFDGTVPAGSFNYVANGTGAGILVGKLVAFFGQGAVLGCTDANFPIYTGNPDMAAVHANMPISLAVFDFFNNALIGVCASAGVTSADQASILAVLQSTKIAICNQADCTICDKYSAFLNVTNVQLVTSVVTSTVNAVVASGTPTLPFFDGTVPTGSFNYVANGTAVGILIGKLVGFFGQYAVLGCSDSTVPPYTGNPNMQIVHQNMPITLGVFNFFNNALLNVLTVAGVTPADVAAVNAILQSTRPFICNQPDCAITSGAVTSAAMTSNAVTSAQITSMGLTTVSAESSFAYAIIPTLSLLVAALLF